MTTKLTDNEVKEVNAIITTLQNHLSNVQDYTKKRQFNDALKEIILSMKATECPLCKEKLAVLSTKIIETKVACKNKDSKCDLIIKEAIDKAESIKNDFVPIATEKRFIKEKTKELKHEPLKLPLIPFPFDPLKIFKNRK